MPDIPDIEGQDQAEVFDEENITPDGRDIATPDLQRDVLDVTSVKEDAHDALAPDPNFDPDKMDEAEYEEVVQAEEDLDEPSPATRDEGDLVAEDDPRPADFEGESPIAEGEEDGTPAPVDEAIAAANEEGSALKSR